MSDPKQVIVYRSRSEQAFDQLVWDYPEIVLAGTAILVAAVLTYFAVNAIRDRWGRH